jgi:hypothetical protein
MKNDHENILLSREKHLDHMVRVVPFIFFCYAIQCFIILKISPDKFSTTSLSVLGGFLALMVAAFITYDLKHQVTLLEDQIQVKFFSSEKLISYHDIIMLHVPDPNENFSSLIIHTIHGKHTFYFVDDAQKIKQLIEDKKTPELLAA